MGNILLADDAKVIIEILTKLLEHDGHNIVGTASNGQEAFELYKDVKPDLVIMGISMPEVDGIEGIKLIKEYDTNARIIICSSLDQKELIMKALYHGAVDFIVKPFKNEKMAETVRNILEND